MKSCPAINSVRAAGAAGPLAGIRIVLGLMLLWSFFDKLLGLATPAGYGWIDGCSPSYAYMMGLN
jgi:hypothetical protein